MSRSVLVTGGGLRLGEQICRQFAAAGWSVWCHYNHSEEEAQSLCDELMKQGCIARVVQADIAEENQRQRMMEHITNESGPLHCLINNASRFEPDAADELNVEAMRRQIEINLLAPLELASLMAQRTQTDNAGSRSILHVLDQKVFNLNPDYFSYTVSKLALERTVALQAQALAPKLRVCGVAPGLMFQSGPQTLENFEIASCINLLRRPTDPIQVAASCLFLAENPCITGVTLTVDNGQHLIPLPRDVMFVVEDVVRGRDAN